MWNRHQSGITLIELIIAIVIVSVGVAGLVGAFAMSTRTSTDPVIYKQMSAIAEALMEEITLKPYTVAANSAPAQAKGRETFNDVRDFNGYSTTTGMVDIDGAAVPGLSYYNVVVSATTPNPGLPNVTTGEAIKIIVTVNYGADGSHITDSFILTSWRTCYGGTPC
ncbi:MAG: prepilin-type N-terminal cleavage/methylation domain-containing protein [Pseudomonadota bacterium]